MVSNKSLSTNEFNSLLEEAETNFLSSRFENAAKTFEHLIEMCLEMKYYEDMIYFTYRAIVCWIQANNLKNVIRIFQKLAINSLKLSTLQAITAMDSITDLETKAEIIRIAQKNLKHLNEEEKRKPLVDTLINIYEKFGDDDCIEYKQRVIYWERVIELLEDMKDFERSKFYVNKLANLIEENAKFILKTSDFDAELVTAHQLIEAAKLYFTSGNIDKFNALIAHALELYPEIDLTKFDLPQVVENYT